MFGRLAIFAAIGATLLGFGKAIREYASYGDASFLSAGADWKFGSSFFAVGLYHLYMTFAYNFAMLDAYVGAMNGNFYKGYFTILNPLDVTPHQKYGITDLQFDVLGIDFHGALTSTLLGIPYIDFGIFGFVPIFVIGFVSQFLFIRAVVKKTPTAIALYAYHAINLFLGFYTYMFTYFFVIFSYLVVGVILPYLCRPVLVRLKAAG